MSNNPDYKTYNSNYRPSVTQPKLQTVLKHGIYSVQFESRNKIELKGKSKPNEVERETRKYFNYSPGTEFVPYLNTDKLIVIIFITGRSIRTHNYNARIIILNGQFK